jgi:hypothetical protein
LSDEAPLPNGATPGERVRARPAADPGSEEGAGAYSRGFGDGVRSALREMMAWAARGHTPAELRIFAESRLAHLDEEVALKRRTLLSAPRAIPLENLLRSRGPDPRPSFPPLLPGYTYLFLEERPQLARRFVLEALPRLGGTLGLTRLAGELRRSIPSDRLQVLDLGVESTVEQGAEPASSNVSGLTGRVQDFLSREKEAMMVYLEALDFLNVWNGFESTMKFLYWASGEIRRHRGVLLVSTDPEAFTLSQVKTLERDFNHVVKAP